LTLEDDLNEGMKRYKERIAKGIKPEPVILKVSKEEVIEKMNMFEISDKILKINRL